MTIKYQQEFLSTCRKSAEVLIQEHWQEIAVNKEKIKLNPDWGAYEELELNGRIKIFTAREYSGNSSNQGTLVGYFVVFINNHLHYKDHVFAYNDILFLKKEYRKGTTGIKLIKFAENALKEDGVSVLVVNTKVHKPFDPVMERLGFNLVERVYSKYIGD